MIGNFSLPEHCKIVAACPNGAEVNTAEVTFDSISLKGVVMAWLVLAFQQAVSDATIITLDVGATVATATTPITFEPRWWKTANIATTDALVAQTAATTQALTAGAYDQVVVIEIDPVLVRDQAATYDCVGGSCAASGQLNYISGFWICQMRYAQATPPSIIVD